MKMQFMGHSPPKDGTHWQTLADHARGVTKLVRQHVKFFRVNNADLDAHWLGLTHDLGKYRLEFQRHRLGWNPVTMQPQSYPEKPAPHSDAGAKAICVLVDTQRQHGSELPFVIANHHGGLRDVPRLLGRLSETAEEEVEDLFALACEDTPELATLLETPPVDTGLTGAARTLYTRMLLGALVDADRLDTESHGSPHNTEAREAARASQSSMAQLFTRLEAAQSEYAAKDVRDPQAINALRREMYGQATNKAALPPGFFRLTMPTGGGKTLTSLGFALSHAAQYGASAEGGGMRRVIYGVPFTTIIEQTASVFREVLGEQNVLEHHSNLEFKTPASGQTVQTPDPMRLATENWDAPVIVTTTVQLFQETLFGNRTAQLRKLHNVAGSVIVLDEAQSLPTHRLAPILEALRELVAHYHVSVVFCTATQPALDDFPSQQPALELIDHPAHYFQQLQRVEYDLERVRDPTPWADLAAELLDTRNDRVLCIVNTKKHAQELYRLLVYDRQKGDPLRDVYHLSTHLCPHHRRRIFRVITDRLKKGKRCRVIATNLIEAGVDVDFPRVYRALGPLEAIVQAAGRCNREGKLTDEDGQLMRGLVTVFRPEEHKLPPGDYRVRSDLADRYLAEDSDLHAPDTFTPYFRELYQAVSTDTPIKLESGHRATIAQLQDEMDFEAVAKGFEMIEDTTVPVIVRQYAPQEVNRQLNIILNDQRVTQVRAAWRRLQPYTVQVLRRDIKTFDLRVVSELSQKAERFGTEPPEVYEWPLNKRYDLKLGLDTGGMDALVY